jgi:hypothetical protein
MRHRIAAVVLLAATVVACDGATAPAGLGNETTILKVSGDAQLGTGGTPLAQPFVVETVSEVGGVVRPNETVRWEVTSSQGGSLSARETTTDSLGRASVTATLPNLQGAVLTVRASAVGSSHQATFTAEVETTLSGAAGLEKMRGDGQTGPRGGRLADPYVVRVLDAGGGGVADVDVEFWVLDGDGGSLTASTVTTDSNGEAAVRAILPVQANATQRVGATVSSLTDTLVFQSTTTTELAEPTRVRLLSGQAQKGMSDDTLLDPLVVEVTNSGGVVIEDATVRWQVTSGHGGSVLQGATTTDAEGLARNRWRLGTRTGTARDTVIAWIEPQESPPDTVTFVADVTGPPTRIVVTQGAIEEDDNATQEPESVVGDTVTVAPDHWSRKPFKVNLRDAAGRTVRGAVLTWTVTSGGGTLGDEPEGDGQETVEVVTGSDGAVTVWRRATAGAEEGDWIGATLSLENFPDVPPVTLDALVRE